MKRITHVITGLEVGGAERALFNILTGGLQKHFNNNVLSLMDEGAYGPRLRASGVEVNCLGLSPGEFGVRAVRDLLRILRSQAPDIVQGWMYHGNLAASVGRRFAVPRAALAWNIRLSLEGRGEAKLSRRYVIEAGKWLSSGPQAIVYNALRSCEQHEAEGYARDRSCYIPNGFDTLHWRPEPNAKQALLRELGLNSDVKIVGFVGRANEQKDIPNLFSAFQSVSDRRSDCHLVCIGRGIVDAVPDILDRSRVTFLGQRSDVHKLMPALDLLCLSSWAEGFPNVIGEAMACGVPCVTTNVGDAADVVAGTGWVVPPRDPVALACAIEDALGMPDIERVRRGQAARRRIEEHYSLQVVVDKYAALYSSLTSRS